MRLMIHTIQPGDVLSMVGPDGKVSNKFTLAEIPVLRADYVWLYRENDVPIVVDRVYGIEASFVLHGRRTVTLG